jgi:hypothetical protein
MKFKYILFTIYNRSEIQRCSLRGTFAAGLEFAFRVRSGTLGDDDATATAGDTDTATATATAPEDASETVGQTLIFADLIAGSTTPYVALKYYFLYSYCSSRATKPNADRHSGAELSPRNLNPNPRPIVGDSLR